MVFVPREQPSQRDLQLFGRKVLIVAAALIALALLWAVRGVLILIALAAVLAAGIAPVVQRVRILVRHFLHRHISRGPAVLIVYFPFHYVAVVLLVFMVPRLVDEHIAQRALLPRRI